MFSPLTANSIAAQLARVLLMVMVIVYVPAVVPIAYHVETQYAPSGEIRALCIHGDEFGEVPLVDTKFIVWPLLPPIQAKYSRSCAYFVVILIVIVSPATVSSP